MTVEHWPASACDAIDALRRINAEQYQEIERLQRELESRDDEIEHLEELVAEMSI